MSDAFRSTPALVLIDVQELEWRGARSNNREAVLNMARLLSASRQAGWKESAEDIHAMSLSNLDGDFATIETTDTVPAALPQPVAA